MPSIDLNCDLGEGAGLDAELIPWISSANVACGAHAGNLETMIETLELARRHRVAVGAHPGFFDLDNFGRLERAIAPEEASRIVLMQVEQFFELAGEELHHVKLHGALYNQVSRDAVLADAVAADLARLWPNLIVFALAGSVFARTAAARGLRVAPEGFADRTYRADGSLTPRGEPGALIENADGAVRQALGLARNGSVQARDGTEVKLTAETICLHGDGAHAVEFARRLKTELKQAGIRVRAIR